MKLPRFARRWATRRDTNFYSGTGPGLVFSSGPFEDKFYWRERTARAYAETHPHTNLYRLGWKPQDET